MLAGAVALAPIQSGRINYVLIDHENVQPTDLGLLHRADIRLWVFVGAGQAKLSSELAIQMQAMRERADYVRICGNGPNALDFHIAFYIGQLSGNDPDGFFHIISRDTGFDPLVEHLKARKIRACRSASIAGMPLFRQTVATDAVAVPATKPKPKPKAKAVTVVVEKAPAPPPQGESAASVTATQRLTRMKTLLSKTKTGRPGTLAALKKHVAAHFQNQIGAEDVGAIIAGLEQAGVVKLEGLKVRYG
ncbi:MULTISPECIES: PIN domain-containing protein [Stenotrophomonas]|uniref:PIN domain-containing protein n=1 Tax=Stenotrophomonas TaxID=40323 RepID=UPI001CF3CD3B|nr:MULTISPECIES: PIN domain-containing protein [Stenotrophomonas]MCA7025448.1 PIN domain-containing protein [Stenotrophomonas acidaminiphila]MCE4075600.1 PIN domain-containing protein [Stenotrophomonas acidaminiphila]